MTFQQWALVCLAQTAAGAVGDSRESLDYAGHESVSDVEYTSGIDQDLARMDSLMTVWTGELKKNVMVRVMRLDNRSICFFDFTQGRELSYCLQYRFGAV
jgi:hypothetical protein